MKYSEKYFLSKILENVKDEYTGKILEGKPLKSEYLKLERKPEDLTKDLLIEALKNDFGLTPTSDYETVGFDTQPKVRLASFVTKSIEKLIRRGELRWPDIVIVLPKQKREEPFGEKNLILIEVEPYNENLWARGKGVNQVVEWVRAFHNIAIGVATNLKEWVVMIHMGGKLEGGSLKESILEQSFTYEEFRDWLNYMLGRKGRSFADVFLDKHYEEITKNFYDHYYAVLFGGSYRGPDGKTYKISEKESLVESIRCDECTEDDRIEYARLFLTRMMFIKILIDRGILRSDLFEILKSFPPSELPDVVNKLFFSVFNTQKDERVDIPEEFKDLPYLNGGLFSEQKIGLRQLDERSFYIPAKKILTVIKFLETYKFTREEQGETGAISPEILGYVFEKTIANRKETGAYYTPKYVTRYISENAITHYLLDRINKLLKERNWSPVESIDEFLTEGYDPKLIRKVYDDLKNIKILDPAVGSGAFLLSAGEVLLELHRKFLRALHKEDEFDPYEIKKHIVQHNLFGVDINRSAVEIAKLRLWLWITEDATTSNDIRPLPNIDYNLVSGNSLIGYLKEIPEDTKIPEDLWVTNQHLKRFIESIKNENKKKALKRKLSSFWTKTFEIDLKQLVEMKKNLIEIYYSEDDPRIQKFFRSLTEDVSKLMEKELHKHYYKKVFSSDENLDLVDFFDLKPFHWVFAFPEVLVDGENGFDVIVGNPPYVDMNDLKKKEPKHWLALTRVFEIRGWKDVKDLYDAFIRLSFRLLHEGGWLGMIHPNSVYSGKKFKELREYIIKNGSDFTIVNYAIRPQPVFRGAVQRVAITICRKDPNGPKTFRTSGYIRLTPKKRKELLTNPPLYDSTPLVLKFKDKFIPKIGNEHDYRIFKTLSGQPKEIKDILSKRGRPVFFHDSGESYWTKAINVPLSDFVGGPVPETQWKELKVKDEYYHFTLAVLNSTLFYWFWLTISDARHLTKSVIEELPVPDEKTIEKYQDRLSKAVEELLKCYKKNTIYDTSRKTRPVEFKIRLCAPKIFEIDRLLGEIYGLSDEDIEYIINYDKDIRFFDRS